ncbi:hypothetical protein [Microbacterium soli]|uniref:Peptidase S74 domain-containing protein n=1 Tax=Microbacterium soli TaxID=446075 RepID=A0ABP7NK26_9MICO
MAIGDAAVAAGMPIVDGATTEARTLDTEINRTRDLIAERTSDVVPVAKGGTGATTPATARAALGAVAASEVADPGEIRAGAIVRYKENTRLTASHPVEPTDLATKQYVDVAALPVSGGTVTGNLYLPNSTSASSSYTVAYINGDGRVSRGASSERYKSDIDRDPDLPGVLDAAPITSYTLTDDPEHVTRYGPIAEDLDDDPRTANFVVYDDQGRPDSFDMISYLMAATGELHARVRALEADNDILATGLDLLAQRISTLEAQHADQ